LELTLSFSFSIIQKRAENGICAHFLHKKHIEYVIARNKKNVIARSMAISNEKKKKRRKKRG